MLKDFFMPIKKLSIYAISEEWPQEELNTNFQFASTAKKNTLPYEGGGSFLIFKCHLKIFLTHFSYLFSCLRETWVLGAKMKEKNPTGGCQEAEERERKRKELNSREEERQMYAYTQVR